MELHPLCTLFPRMSGAEFESLKFDILANGLQEPIVVHDGFILDGGNRYAACIAAGVVPVLKDFSGTSPAAFVLSANLHRRHLTPGQQAAIVASAQDWASAQPAHRPEKGGNVAGLSTVADRAAQSGASERTQRMADTVAKQSPDLARQVAHGEISLPKALEQLTPRSEPPRPAAAPEAPSPADVGADDLPDDDGAAVVGQLIEENRQLVTRVEALEQEVAFLKQDDMVALAAEWKLKFEQLAGRNRDLQQKARDAQVDLRSRVEFLAKIRKALAVETDAQILPAIGGRRAS